MKQRSSITGFPKQELGWRSGKGRKLDLDTYREPPITNFHEEYDILILYRPKHFEGLEKYETSRRRRQEPC
jgi:hypothetical protein